jgi:hypothetical protein
MNLTADRLPNRAYWWGRKGSLDRAMMNSYSWLAALFIILALAGCTKGTAGQAGTPYPPYSPQNNENVPEHGGGDGGGGGGGGSM